MRMKCFFAFICLVVISVVGLSAQATVNGTPDQTVVPQVVNPNPASREDAEKTTAEVKKLREEVKKSSEEAVKTRGTLQSQGQEILKKSDEVGKKLDGKVDTKTFDQATAKLQRSVESNAETFRKVGWGVGVVVIVVFSLFISALGVFLVRGRTKTPAGLMHQMHQRQLTLVQPTGMIIHDKTDIKSVQRFVDENSTLKSLLQRSDSVEVPATLVLKKRLGHDEDLEGEFDCTLVLFKKDETVKVRFSELPAEEFGWKNRNVGAAKVAKKRQEKAA